MAIERFEDAIAWQKSKVLCVEVYKQFENSKDFGFKDQIQRAAVSVMNNIAEGFERKGNKEFAYFLYVAKGSCSFILYTFPFILAFPLSTFPFLLSTRVNRP